MWKEVNHFAPHQTFLKLYRKFYPNDWGKISEAWGKISFPVYLTKFYHLPTAFISKSLSFPSAMFKAPDIFLLSL